MKEKGDCYDIILHNKQESAGIHNNINSGSTEELA
jgi:hypothetical protein